MNPPSTRPRLISIAPSHYCEKARWCLHRAGIAVDEDLHPAGFHMLAVKRAGGARATPVLVIGDVVLNGSDEISAWLQQRPDALWRPYGSDPSLRAPIESFEHMLGKDLGPHTRRLLYFHALADKPLITEVMGRGAPLWEAAAFRFAYPLLARWMRRQMRIDAEGARRSRLKIWGVFEAVAKQAGPDQAWLFGDSMTVADVAFAALAAPVLMPPEYGGPIPVEKALPPSLMLDVQAFRAHPAGVRALRLYRQTRSLT